MYHFYCKYIRPYKFVNAGNIWIMRINLFPISIEAWGNDIRDNMIVKIHFSWKV